MKVDKESIDPSLLETIDIDSDIRQTCCTVLYTDILCSVYDELFQYEIEIEYTVDNKYINDRSLDNYIRTYESAVLTQEEITSMVFKDINELLDSDVYVDVECMDLNKQTWVSGPSTIDISRVGNNNE